VVCRIVGVLTVPIRASCPAKCATFAFSSGGRRRSEVTAAVMENLVKVDEQTYVYRLTHSKTDQAGTEHNADADKPVVGPAAEALTAWLDASGVKSGAIFRRIRRTKAVEPLLPQAVWHIVKRRVQLAGLEGDFGAHSLRSGYVTEPGRQNVPIREAMGIDRTSQPGDLHAVFPDGGRSEYTGRQLVGELNQAFRPSAGSRPSRAQTRGSGRSSAGLFVVGPNARASTHIPNRSHAGTTAVHAYNGHGALSAHRRGGDRTWRRAERKLGQAAYTWPAAFRATHGRRSFIRVCAQHCSTPRGRPAARRWAHSLLATRASVVPGTYTSPILRGTACG